MFQATNKLSIFMALVNVFFVKTNAKCAQCTRNCGGNLLTCGHPQVPVAKNIYIVNPDKLFGSFKPLLQLIGILEEN